MAIFLETKFFLLFSEVYKSLRVNIYGSINLLNIQSIHLFQESNYKSIDKLKISPTYQHQEEIHYYRHPKYQKPFKIRNNSNLSYLQRSN